MIKKLSVLLVLGVISLIAINSYFKKTHFGEIRDSYVTGDTHVTVNRKFNLDDDLSRELNLKEVEVGVEVITLTIDEGALTKKTEMPTFLNNAFAGNMLKIRKNVVLSQMRFEGDKIIVESSQQKNYGFVMAFPIKYINENDYGYRIVYISKIEGDTIYLVTQEGHIYDKAKGLEWGMEFPYRVVNSYHRQIR